MVETRVINGIPIVHRRRPCRAGGLEFTECIEPVIRTDHQQYSQDTGGKFRRNPSPPQRAPELRFDVSPGERWTAWFNRLNRPIPLDPNPPDPLAQEVARLREAFPLIAEYLAQKMKFVPRRPPGLFPLGDVVDVSTSATMLGVRREAMLAALDRHDHRDHGQYGSSLDIEPSEDQLWCPHLFDQRTQNAVAIKTGRGLVISSYAISDLVGPPTPSSPHRSDDRLIICTWLAGDRTRTTAATSREDTL